MDGNTFTDFANLAGTTGDDTFAIVNDGSTTFGSVSGTIDGLGQALADTLDISGVTGATTVDLAGTAVSGGTTVGSFTGVEALVGNDGTTGTSTTLAGDNTGDAFVVDAANGGTLTYNTGATGFRPRSMCRREHWPMPSAGTARCSTG